MVATAAVVSSACFNYFNDDSAVIAPNTFSPSLQPDRPQPAPSAPLAASRSSRSPLVIGSLPMGAEEMLVAVH
jgi:hypothetical protein